MMKRYAAVVAVLLFVCFLAGCNTANDKAAGIKIPNPLRDSTHDEILETLGINMHIPEGATDVAYTIIDNEEASEIAQAKFTFNNIKYTYRIRPSAKFEDISGAYYEWKTVEGKDVSYCKGELKYNDGKQGAFLWYDAVPGLMYSVYTEDGATGETLTEVAEELFVEAEDVP